MNSKFLILVLVSIGLIFWGGWLFRGYQMNNYVKEVVVRVDTIETKVLSNKYQGKIDSLDSLLRLQPKPPQPIIKVVELEPDTLLNRLNQLLYE